MPSGEDVNQFCAHCGAGLSRYGDPDFCPECGQLPFTTSKPSSKPEFSVSQKPCAACFADLSEHYSPDYCPSCGRKQLDDATRTDAAELLGRALLIDGRNMIPISDDASYLQPDELAEIIELVNCTDSEFKYYALHALMMYSPPFTSRKVYEPVLEDGLDVLISSLDEYTDGEYFIESNNSDFITHIIDAIINLLNEQKLVDEQRADTLADIAIQMVGQIGGSDDREWSTHHQVISRVVALLSEIVTVERSLLEPALEDIVEFIEYQIQRYDGGESSANTCPVCDAHCDTDTVNSLRPAVELIREFSESHPSDLEGVVSSVLDYLGNCSPPEADEWLVSDSMGMIADLADEYPELVGEKLPILTEFANFGELRIPPESTIIGGRGTMVREDLATILATLVTNGVVEVSVVTDGLESDEPVYVETMVMATKEIAENNPGLLDDVEDSILCLLDEDRHFSISGPAADIAGHLELSAAAESLLKLYAGEYKMGGEAHIRSSSGKALDKLASANVAYSDSGEGTFSMPALQCGSCGEPLDEYDTLGYCPDCGTALQ